MITAKVEARLEVHAYQGQVNFYPTLLERLAHKISGVVARLFNKSVKLGVAQMTENQQMQYLYLKGQLWVH